MHRIVKLLFCSFLFAINISAEPTSNNAAHHNSLADIIEPLMPSVVNVYTVKYAKNYKRESFSHPFFDKSHPFSELFKDFDMFFGDGYSNPEAKSLGSGFIIDYIDNTAYIVTNYHVIQDSDKVNIKIYDGTELPAKIIGTDPRTDLALLQVTYKTKLNPVKFGNSDIARVGDTVFAIGNPFGLGGTVTRGIISSKARDITIDSDNIVNNFIQTDAAINTGNSGGPLFNLAGEVIGINTMIYTQSGGNVGIGFATPSDTARVIIEQLRKHGKITRGFLNIHIQKLTDEVAEGLGIKKDLGILITSVGDNGPAAKAGLKPGDVIIEYNNTTVNDYRKLQILVADTPINTSVDVVIIRSGKRKKVSIYITERERESVESNNNEIIELCGVKFSNLTNRIKEHSNIPKNQTEGILVQKVERNSIWRKFLVSEDIILQVNNSPINSISDFSWQYKQAKRNKKQNIILLLKRDKSTLFFALPIS